MALTLTGLDQVECSNFFQEIRILDKSHEIMESFVAACQRITKQYHDDVLSVSDIAIIVGSIAHYYHVSVDSKATEKEHHKDLNEEKNENMNRFKSLPRKLATDLQYDRPFVCQQCGDAFRWKRNLKQHRLVHKNERPFICRECGKSFKSNGCLTMHLRIHSDNREFVCDKCGKSFTYSSNKIRHMQVVHSDERPYKCGVCGRRFKEKATLKTHMQSHTQERPFKCQECGKQFGRSPR
ncbi:gastrula zinc finger protein XlCGF49.1-like [Ptychodera flava]|uniref:gastrula zinc finger protein XlCGF49.1-like n=1 Tax=Ptychodera flava TaxID=63121 RepID=UPI00396A8871